MLSILLVLVLLQPHLHSPEVHGFFGILFFLGVELPNRILESNRTSPAAYIREKLIFYIVYVLAMQYCLLLPIIRF